MIFDGDHIGISLGTWKYGRDEDIESRIIHHAYDLGVRVFDTSEHYGDGAAERILGKALRGKSCIIVSKVVPSNAKKIRESCQRSLKNLCVDSLDAYLLNWMTDDVSLTQLSDDMNQLVAEGLIKQWGVSDMSSADLNDLGMAGAEISIHQMRLDYTTIGSIRSLEETHADMGITVMGYGVFQSGALFENPYYMSYCRSMKIDPASLAMSWARETDCLPIFRSHRIDHVDSLLEMIDVRPHIAALKNIFR